MWNRWGTFKDKLNRNYSWGGRHSSTEGVEGIPSNRGHCFCFCFLYCSHRDTGKPINTLILIYLMSCCIWTGPNIIYTHTRTSIYLKIEMCAGLKCWQSLLLCPRFQVYFQLDVGLGFRAQTWENFCYRVKTSKNSSCFRIH